MRKRQVMSIVLIVIMITSLMKVFAFVSGHSGSMSPGDIVSARGGINWTAYNVCFVNMEGENALSKDDEISHDAAIENYIILLDLFISIYCWKEVSDY